MKLALGTVQFGLPYGIANQVGQVSQSNVAEILSLAASYGVNTLDTAVAYGSSEAILGAVGINDWQVISKLPALPQNCPNAEQWVEEQLLGSLKRLKLSQLDALLLHRPEQLLGGQGEALYRAMQIQQSKGLVEKIGISIYQPEELEAIFPSMAFDIVQAPFNILDRRLKDSGWLSRLNSQGVELHVRSVFMQGLLLMQPEQRPHKFKRWDLIWDTWRSWLNDNQLSPVEACLRYVLSQNEISKIVVGVDNPQQLKQIITASYGDLPLVPENLGCSDIDLLNPSHWSRL